ncbi:N-acetyltransferase family protein, partial [Pseudomonas aeruginosa]
GFASFRRTEDFAHYQPQRADAPRAYICEAVVHPAAAGQGLGSALLEAVLAQLADEGIEDVYIDRHEENLASAGMMRKAGFVELETYADPARRPNGSGRSTVCHRNLSLQRRAVR